MGFNFIHYIQFVLLYMTAITKANCFKLNIFFTFGNTTHKFTRKYWIVDFNLEYNIMATPVTSEYHHIELYRNVRYMISN